MTTTQTEIETAAYLDTRLSIEERMEMSHEALDAEIAKVAVFDPDARSPRLRDLFAERGRRIRVRAREIAEAEAEWEAEIDAVVEPGSDAEVEHVELLFKRAEAEPTDGRWAMRLVRCPKCGAARGFDCTGRQGQTLKGGRRSHTERVGAAGRFARKMGR